MATDFEQSAAYATPLPTQLDKAQDSCESPPVSPERELEMGVLMVPKRTRCGVGRIVNRARALPEPIVEFEVE